MEAFIAYLVGSTEGREVQRRQTGGVIFDTACPKWHMARASQTQNSPICSDLRALPTINRSWEFQTHPGQCSTAQLRHGICVTDALVKGPDAVCPAGGGQGHWGPPVPHTHWRLRQGPRQGAVDTDGCRRKPAVKWEAAVVCFLCVCYKSSVTHECI